jgi:transposase-like protein
MDLIEVYKIFPAKADCIKHLETLRWPDKPICPYCKSVRQSKLNNQFRYHCNTCNTSFSVTVGTLFENSKIDLQKWFYAICVILNSRNKISSRQLANKIRVTKDTAWLIEQRIRNAISEFDPFFNRLIQMTERTIKECI